MYLVFTCMPCESYRRWLRFLLLCYVFQALINSLVCWFCTGTLGLVLVQIQNSASKLILKSCRAEHAKPLLKQLHWLPAEQRIKYKIACLCYQIIIGAAHQYSDEFDQIYVPFRSLVLLWMIELFASPPSKENSMVVVPSASLLHKSGIIFLLIFVTTLPSLPSKLALKHTSSNSLLTSKILCCTNLEFPLFCSQLFCSCLQN